MNTGGRMGSVFLRGSAWGLMGQGLQYAALFIGSIVLARLLPPADFGAAGVVLGWAGLVVGICQMGYASALVARPNMSDEEQETLLWIHVLVAVAAAAFVWICASRAALFLHKHDVADLMRLSSAFVFASIASVFFLSCLQSQLRIRAHQSIVGFSVVFGTAAACAAAWTGCGAASIVLGMVGASGFQLTAGALLVRPRIRFRFHPACIKRHGDFGGCAWLTNIINLVINNGTAVLLGRVWPVHELGLFQFAQRRMQQPYQMAAGVMGAVLFPVLRRLREDESRFKCAVTDVTKTIVLIVVPLYAGLIVFAPQWIGLLYGERWLETVPLFRILALSVFARMFSTAASNAFYASEAPQEGLRNAAVRLIVWAPLMGLVVFRQGWSPVAVAWGWMIMETTACLTYAVRLFAMVRMSPRDFVGEFRPLMAGWVFILLWAAAVTAAPGMRRPEALSWWLLGGWIVAGCVGYAWVTRAWLGRLWVWMQHALDGR